MVLVKVSYGSTTIDIFNGFPHLKAGINPRGAVEHVKFTFLALFESSLPTPVGTHKLCMKVENPIPVVWLRVPHNMLS